MTTSAFQSLLVAHLRRHLRPQPSCLRHRQAICYCRACRPVNDLSATVGRNPLPAAIRHLGRPGEVTRADSADSLSPVTASAPAPSCPPRHALLSFPPRDFHHTRFAKRNAAAPSSFSLHLYFLFFSVHIMLRQVLSLHLQRSLLFCHARAVFPSCSCGPAHGSCGYCLGSDPRPTCPSSVSARLSLSAPAPSAPPAPPQPVESVSAPRPHCFLPPLFHVCASPCSL